MRFRVDDDVTPEQVMAFAEQQVSGMVDQMFAEDLKPRKTPNMNQGIGSGRAAMIAMGREATNVARGVGLADPEPPQVREQYERLEERRPYSTMGGAVAGGAAPFLVPGMATSRIASPILRVLSNVGLGASEGAILAKGEGRSSDDVVASGMVGGLVAGVSDVLFPVLSSLGRQIVRKAGKRPSGPVISEDGSPTAEFQQALDETGTTYDQVVEDAVAQLKPEDVERLRRFESQGVRPFRGNVTQEFSDQAAQERLADLTTPEGSLMRQQVLGQSQDFTAAVNSLIEDLGVPGETGEALKDALAGRKELLREQKNRLYQQVAEVDPNVGSIPLMTDSIRDAIPDEDTLEDLAMLNDTQVSAVRRLLVKYGIDQSEEAVEGFNGRIQPLTLGNLERFRKGLNLAMRSDQTGATSVVARPILDALDAEAEIVDTSIRGYIKDASILDTLKEARGVVREMKTDFSPQSITGRLIGVKKDGVTSIIQASKVAPELLSPNAPTENLRDTLNLLAKSPNGPKAIGDLQASVVLMALEDSLKASTRKVSGETVASGNQFAKVLDKFGDDKLELLFKGKGDQLKRLRELRQVGLDMTSTNRAAPKGSGAIILDKLNEFNQGRLGTVVRLARMVNDVGEDQRALQRILNAEPRLVEDARMIKQQYPQIAAALGIAAIVQEDEDDG